MKALGHIGRIALALLLLALGCKSQDSSAPKTANIPKNAIEIQFAYGSEKQKWIDDVTEQFNRGNSKTSTGKIIQVKALPMGSGECIDSILDGSVKADLVSPASGAFIKLGNAQSRTKTGKDMIGSTENLVLSPVVIAMWKPMAEALGWPGKPVGWSDILTLAKSQQGWAGLGNPQWGQFKFGHTHPQYSNSGLMSVFAEESDAASGKVSGLTLDDLQKPQVASYVDAIEHSVVHYGSSTGFFGRKLFENGPRYLSAAVLYENMVIESYGSEYHLDFPAVAVYPKEGTFWSDHPAGIVQREWVTPERKEAAQKYLDFLLDRPQQQKALQYGFRPAAVDVPLGSPIDQQHGVDPKEPKTTLEVPSVEVMDGITRLWHLEKKRANVILVLDTSGSMEEQQKMVNAREGAQQLISLMSDDDDFALLPFSSTPAGVPVTSTLKNSRTQVSQRVSALFPQGGTALYDAINVAYTYIQAHPQPDKISAIVVLTDGDDRDSKMNIQQLLQQIQFDYEHKTTRVFTIGYGADAQKDVLKKIADATNARFYEGTPKNIKTIFADISTFF